MTREDELLQIAQDRFFADGVEAPGVRPCLLRVALETTKVVDEMFAGAVAPDNRPIVCIFRPGRAPQTDPINGGDCLLVYLSVGTTNYDQFVYEFAHELGHVMLGPRRAHAAAEALAVAISHDALDRLTKVRIGEPWFDTYAEHFGGYIPNRERPRWLKGFPPAVQASAIAEDPSEARAFLRENTATIVERYSDRDWNTLAAIVLRRAPVDWPALVGVAHQTALSVVEDEQFHTKFPLLFEQCSSAAQAALRPLGFVG